MRRSIYLFMALLLVVILTSCRDDQSIVSSSPETSSVTMKLLSLTSGESVSVGSSQQIKWYSNTSTNINIDYSTNGGSTWDSLAHNISNTGVYVWTPVPNKISNSCLVKVSTLDNPSVIAYSSKDFSIIKDTTVKTLEMLDPNSGSVVYVDSVYSVKWSSTGITTIKISLSTDNGTTWSIIAPSVTASTGAYSWTPNSIYQSLNCKIRIADVSADTISATSSGVFTITIPQSITITQPNGGEDIAAGQNYDIKWTSVKVANVKIEYTTNNGVDWTTIAASTPSNGLYSWSPVPTTLSNNCKLRISDVADGYPSVSSSSVFSISKPITLKIISPNGGEQLLAGTSANITWSSSSTLAKTITSVKTKIKKAANVAVDETSAKTNSVKSPVANVKIEYTTNDGATWSSITASAPNNGSYVWDTIPVVNSSLCKVKVSDASGGSSSATSDNDFTIYTKVAKSIKITSPNGGESWLAGSAQSITWTSAGVSAVKIEYTTNNGVNWTLLTGSVPSSGFYSWTPIPDSTSTNCKIRITDATDASVYDLSDLVFTIAPQPAIVVTAPIGGEVYQSGVIKQITWTSTSIARVKIEYTVNNGADWKTIVADTESSGVYNWTVPNENTTQARVRVSKAGTGIPYGVSGANFTITNQVAKQLVITAPNGGESWDAGTSQQITWSGTGVTKVKIEYTTDNELNWNTIVSSVASSGSYSWNPVPNTASTQCKVRISDASNGTPTVKSNAVFTIKPIKTIKVLKPNGGEVWTAGVADTIKWESSGVTNVRIEYTINNGIDSTDWKILVASTPSTGSYLHGFTNASTLCKVRISDATDNSPRDESDGTFTVLPQPSITVNSPAGGEQYLAGTKQNITWTSTSVSNVKIEFTTNNGSTWSTIIASTPSSGLYAWTIPTDSLLNSSLCKVRISNVLNNGDPSATSANTFTINQVAPGITVTSPKGGETWNAMSQQAITWNSSGVSNVKIEYTSNNGVNWSTVAASVPSNGYYSWNPIPNTPSTNCKVRITDVANNYTGQSAQTFTISPEPSITVTAPVGGEVYQSGVVKQITWTSVNIANVKIEYTINGGADWKTIIADTASGGVYNWTVPNENTNQAKVRVSKSGTGIPYGMSDNNFTINNQVVKTLAVVSPNGGESWVGGSSKQITWTSSGVANVKIEYSTNGGSVWQTVIASVANTGSYAWNPVPNVTSSQCLIKISDASSGTPSATSAAVFSISPSKVLTILKPLSGDVWTAGVADTIKWASTGISNVKIEYTPNNDEVWIVLAPTVASNGAYVTGFSVASTQYKIKITDADNGTPSVTSNGTFTVLPQPSVTVTSPIGGEQYIVGTTQNIKWSSANVADVKIELTTNSGASWSTIINSVPSNGLYAWAIPANSGINSSLCKVRISNVLNNGNPSATSANNFTISQVTPSITVTSPNGGESWVGGSSQNITWGSSGISNVKIDYTTNNGVDWISVVSSVPSNGSYVWNPLPNISSTNCKVRITDIASSYLDESDAVFTITPKPSIVVTSPNGGENWMAGSSQNITWNSSGITNVKIEYSTNKGADWTVITSSAASSTGVYSWSPIPNISSINCLVRISDPSGNYADQSDAAFTITPQPSVKVTSPNGGETWVGGSSQNITWSSTGVSNVKIEYTTNNGVDWSVITASVQNSGSYSWSPIPGALSSSSCKIRITDIASGVTDQSDAVFTITPQPSVKVTSPNGGETWVGGEAHNITWNSVGMANVKIESTDDNGYTWKSVIASTPAGLGSYTWSSSISSTLYKIRISNVDNSGIPSDESDGTFTITPEPSITVKSPNGGENWLTGQTYEIRWTSSNIANVKIEYTLNNGNDWNTITSNVVSNGLYNWTVPSAITYRSDLCKIRITEIGGVQHSDMSDATFTMHPQDKLLRIDYPNGGESFTDPSDTIHIIWTTAGIKKVKLEYTIDNGANWNTILDSVQSTGAYVWNYTANLGSTVTSLARIRVTDVNPNVGETPLTDESDSYFSIGVIVKKGVNGSNSGGGSTKVGRVVK